MDDWQRIANDISPNSRHYSPLVIGKILRILREFATIPPLLSGIFQQGGGIVAKIWTDYVEI